MFELSLNHIKKYMDATLILEDITFQVYSGERVGIVGPNGCGKSTVMKLIAGIIPLNCYPGSKSLGYDEGWIALPKEATVSYLDQIPEYPESYTVHDVLKLAFEEVLTLEAGLRLLEDDMKTLEGEALERLLRKYSEELNLFEHKGGYAISEKMNRVCTGLNFSEAFLNRPFALLSGGEKTTVILGKILLDNPDILLLDEPTNHLDIDAIEWLEGYLKQYEGIVMIVSHDRYFLDNVVEKIIEIEDQVCSTFKGNYSSYASQKEELMMKQFADFKEQQKQIEAMEKAIKDLREWAKRADNNKFFRRAASLQLKLDKMQRIDRPQFDKVNMKIDLKVKERSGNETIKAVDLHKAYDEKILFKEATLLIQYGERVALVGPNGSGKTTFLRMLLGFEKPDQGYVSLGSSVKQAYLPQVIEFTDENLTVIESFREDKDIPEGKAREYLSKFMFYGSAPFKKVKHLSGGERIRLKLANLLYQDVNLLILDEPTNHLDIESIETLEEALDSFKGTIFFISHDRYFITKMAKRVVAIDQKGFKNYISGYEAYKLDRLKKKEAEMMVDVKPKKVAVEKPQTEEQIAKSRAVKLAKIEVEIGLIEEELVHLDFEMNENAMQYDKLNDLYARRQHLNEKTEVLMSEWMQLQN